MTPWRGVQGTEGKGQKNRKKSRCKHIPGEELGTGPCNAAAVWWSFHLSWAVLCVLTFFFSALLDVFLAPGVLPECVILAVLVIEL